MTAPAQFLNSIIATPAVVGPVPQYTPLTLAQGSSLAGTWCWIVQCAGVDPASCVASAVFRQLPTDAPLLTVTSAASSLGQITYQAAIPNFPYLPPSLDEAGLAPVPITVYPFKLAITAAGMALLNVPYCQWSLDLTWPDSTVTQIMRGEVFVSSV